MRKTGVEEGGQAENQRDSSSALTAEEKRTARTTEKRLVPVRSERRRRDVQLLPRSHERRET